jgi:hypothetical protein
MRIEELQQGSLPFRRLLSGTWRVYQGNFPALAAYLLIFGAPGFVAQMLLPFPIKPTNLGSALGLGAMAIPLGIIAGYGHMAIAWSVSRVVSGEPCAPRSAIRAALAATPRYLPAATAFFIAGLLLPGLLAAAFVATLRHLAGLALIIIVGVLGLASFILPCLFIANALCFVPTIVVLRPLSWAGALSRSWALVRGRWWRVFGMTLTLELPGLILMQSGQLIPHTIPFRAGSELVQLLLAPFATVGVTLLFLHLDFLGPASAPARSDPAPATAEVTP